MLFSFETEYSGGAEKGGLRVVTGGFGGSNLSMIRNYSKEITLEGIPWKEGGYFGRYRL